MTITGMIDMNLPIMPSTKNSGMKAAIEVIIENTTGVPTSSAPSMAARPKDFPCTRWGKDVFADDDRVIDDDAQGHDKGEQR